MVDKGDRGQNDATAEPPRITYHAPGRTFDRLFKEKSLEETKEVVRRKLGLDPDVTVELAQLRDEKKIDLDDGDDFEAFRAVARSKSHADVLVIIKDDTPHAVENGSEVITSKFKSKKRPQSPSPTLPEGIPSKKPKSRRTTKIPLEDTALPAPLNGKPKKRTVTFGDANESSASQDLMKALSSSAHAKPLPVDIALVEASSPQPASPPQQQVKDKKPPRRNSLSVPPDTSMADSDLRKLKASKRGSVSRRASVSAPSINASASASIYDSSKDATISAIMSSLLHRRQSSKSVEVDTAMETVPAPSAASTLPPTTSMNAALESTAPRKRKRQTEDLVLAEPPSEPTTKKSRKKKILEETTSVPSVVAEVASPSMAGTPTSFSAKPLPARRRASTLIPADASGTPTVRNAQAKDAEKVHSLADIISGRVAPLKIPALPPIDVQLPVDASSPLKVKKKKKKSKKDRVTLHAAPAVPVEDVPIPPTPTAKSKTRKTDEHSLDSHILQKKPKVKELGLNGVGHIEGFDVTALEAAASATEDAEHPPTKKRKRNRRDKVAVEDVQTRQRAVSVAKAKELPRSIGPVVSNVDSELSGSPRKVLNESVEDVSHARDGVETMKRKIGDYRLKISQGLAVPAKALDNEAPSIPPEHGKVDLQAVLDAPKSPTSEVSKPVPDEDSCPACFAHPSHPLAACPIVLEGPDSIETCLAELEADSDLVDAEVIANLRALAEKARSEEHKFLESDATKVGATRESTSSPEGTPETALPIARDSPTSANKPTLPVGLAISEVHMESRDEGSSNESSDDEEEEEWAPVRPTQSSAMTEANYEDQLAALMRGLERPRKSILDEIPSHSSTKDSDEEREDILLDEEEDFNRQPSRRRLQKFARRSSSEPDAHRDSDVEDGSSPVFMDGSAEVPVQEFPDATPPPPPEPEVPVINIPLNDPPSTTDTPTAVDSVPPPNNSEKEKGSTLDERAPEVKDAQDEPSPRPLSPESDATAINTEPIKFPVLVAAPLMEPVPAEADRILVPATPERPSGLGDAESSEKESIVEDNGPAAGASASHDKNDDVESIETAEGLLERCDPEPDDDPIENDLAPREPSVDPTPMKPGTVRRMKNRHGQSLSSIADLPVLASQVTDPDPDLSDDGGSVVTTRRSGRLASRQPDAVSAEAPKKRGRQPLSAEEKERRAAVKQAEKEEKARARADKARIAREKKAAEKGKSMPPPRSTRSTRGKAVDADEADIMTPVADPPPSEHSQAKWATLPEPELTLPSESSAVDELGSSSPAPSGVTSRLKVLANLPPSSDVDHSPVAAYRQPSPVQVEQPASDYVETPEVPISPLPLFYPGSSQFPTHSQLSDRALSPGSAKSAHSDNEEAPSPEKPRMPRRLTATYRRLTDIASQGTLFSPSQVSPGASPAAFDLGSPPKPKKSGLYTQADDEDSSDSESESDSDATPRSHIPKDRMVGVNKRKESGLLSRLTK